MTNIKINIETEVCDIILGMDRPFRVSQLLNEACRRGISNKDIVLDVLDQLCESGIIRYSEVENDVWAYRKSPQYV